MHVPETPVTALADDAVMLDVREPAEWAAGRASNAVHVPLAELPGRLAELPAGDGTLPVICRSGARSARAVAFLAAHGVRAVNVDGGMQAWRAAGKPMTSDRGTPSVL